MIENLDILFKGKNQSLVFQATEGVPECVVSSVVLENCSDDDSVAEKALTGVATPRSTPDASLTAPAGVGEKDRSLIPVDSSDGFERGGRYVITDAGGECEWIEVREVLAGSIRVRIPLRNIYGVGDKIRSTEISHRITDAWLADEANVSDLRSPNPRYRWRLEYMVDCKTYTQAIYFDLVRYSRGYSATILDVDALYPGFSDRLPSHYREDAGELIKQAYRQVKMDMHGAGKADQMARNRELVDELVVHRTALIGMRAQLAGGANLSIEAIDEVKLSYEQRFQAFIAQSGLLFDGDEDGSADSTPRSRIFRR